MPACGNSQENALLCNFYRIHIHEIKFNCITKALRLFDVLNCTFTTKSSFLVERSQRSKIGLDFLNCNLASRYDISGISPISIVLANNFVNIYSRNVENIPICLV